MASENRSNPPAQPTPIYTVYTGHQGRVNYGFYPDPPPKYEHVVNGIPAEQRPPVHAVEQPAGVIFVSPAQVYARKRKTLELICIIFFVTFLISAIITFSSRRS